MALFALVHGAWHGAWCWEKVIPELESRGHSAVAMDMPIEDPEAGWSEYADAVIAAIEGGDAILVGHSMGGIVIPVVADRIAVKHSVFLASILPLPGKSFVQLLGEEPEMATGLARGGMVSHDDGSTSWEKDAAIDVFYQDCSADDAEAAFANLRRQSFVGASAAFLTEKLPNTPSTYIACLQDRMLSPAWGHRTAADLGMDVVEMDASHSPFLSKPAELADILVGLA
jgi:pimeloyl-ACP methyl ester carboxylesterase